MHSSIRALVVGLTLLAVATPQIPAQQGGQEGQQAAPALQWFSVKDSQEQPMGNFVLVRAKLVSVAPPRPNSKQPYSLFIADGTGTAKVVIFQDMWAKLSNTEQLVPGVEVEVCGKVQEYRGETQLNIERETHIRLRPGTEDVAESLVKGGAVDRYTQVSIGTLNLRAVGNRVHVRGVAEKVDLSPEPRTPTRIHLKDDTGTIVVVFWEDTQKALDPTIRLQAGESFEVKGTVDKFREVIQLRVDDPKHVTKVGAAAAAPNPFGGAAAPAGS